MYTSSFFSINYLFPLSLPRMRKTLSLWVDWTRSGVKFFVCLLLVLFFIKWQNLFTGWCTLECVHAVADIWLMNCLINANFIEFDGVNNFIDLKMTITIFDSSTRLTSESIVLAACTSRDNLVFWLDFFAAESHLKWFLSTLWSPSHHANRFTDFLSLKCRPPPTAIVWLTFSYRQTSLLQKCYHNSLLLALCMSKILIYFSAEMFTCLHEADDYDENWRSRNVLRPLIPTSSSRVSKSVESLGWSCLFW